MCKVSSAARLPALLPFLPCFPTQESHSVSPRNEDTKRGRRGLCRVGGSHQRRDQGGIGREPLGKPLAAPTSLWGVAIGDIAE